jgi:hypothetical protein
MPTASAAERSLMRSLVPDTDQVFGPASNEYMLADSDYDNYFTIAGGSVLRAAGFACMAIASSEAIISKKIREQDLQTDGPAVSDALIKKANVLFAQADAQDAANNASQFNIYYWGDDPTPELDEVNVATVWY